MNWKYVSIMGKTAFCLHASEFGVYSTLNILERWIGNMEASYHLDCDMQRKLKELVYLTLSPHSKMLFYTAGEESFYSLILSQRSLYRGIISWKL